MFDDAATAATVRFKDIGPHAANFNQQLKLIKATAREAGATTEFTAAQSAKALDFLARAGFTSAEAIGSLRSMINLATASGEDFALVADFSSDLLGAFGLNVDDTAQKIKNLSRLNDVLTKTANTANVTVEDMFETMKVAAPIAIKFGASLEEVASLTAIMGSAGIKGSQGATALKNIFTRLAAPTKEVRKGLGLLNLTQADLIAKSGKMKSATEILGLIGQNLKGIEQPKQLQALAGILGKFALAGGANLIDAISNVDKFQASLLGAGGTAEATGEIMRKSLGNRLKTLQSAAIETGFRFLSAFDKDGRDAITRLTEAVRGFNIQPLINGVKITIRLFSLLVSIVKPFVPLLALVAGGMLAYGVAVKAVAIGSAIVQFVKFVSVIRSLVGAQLLLGVVMAANPIGIIVIAVTALIGLLVVLEKKFKILSRFKVLRDFGRNVKSFFGLGEGESPGGVVAPNKAEVEARQQVNFTGQLNIAGAPPGSTVSGETTGAPPVNMQLLGANP
jgi:TP901 family phage tail tape measure protein